MCQSLMKHLTCIILFNPCSSMRVDYGSYFPFKDTEPWRYEMASMSTKVCLTVKSMYAG